MTKSWFEFDRKITSKGICESLESNEKIIIDNFETKLLGGCSSIRAKEGIRELLRFKEITGKDLDNIKQEDLEYFLKELKQSSFADHTKNKIKDFVQRFLKWKFKDWSERFDEFNCIKINSDAQNKKPISSKTIFTPEQVKELLDNEPSLYWKTFLMVQYEGALRTGEVRNLKWDMIDFEDDGFTTLNIPSKKNPHGTTKIKPVVVDIAGNFLKELKNNPQTKKIDSKYVFPSPHNSNKPISKSANIWFNHLTKKVLGRGCNNYLLRHSKGTELQKKVRKGQLSKDNAIEFMRHSEKMFDKVYSHMDQTDIKKLMKKQIYNTEELTKSERDELENIRNQLKTMDEKLEMAIAFLPNKWEKIMVAVGEKGTQ